MNKGKNLEILVRVLQESYKNIPDTKIYSNHKIRDENGNLREIDIFIESFLNGYLIGIAIECKNFRRKIEAKEIEAFSGKCNRLSSINRKIFISSTGFQKSALDSAKYYNIDLYTIKEVSRVDVLDWIEIQNVNELFVEFDIEYKSIKIDLLGEQTDQSNLPKICIDTQIFENKGISKSLKETIVDNINDKKSEIYNLAIIAFINTRDEKLPLRIKLNATLSATGYYLKGNNGSSIHINNLNFNIKIFLNERSLENLNISSYNNIFTNEKKAQLATFSTSSKDKIIAIKKNGMNLVDFYFVDNSGDFQKVKEIESFNDNSFKLMGYERD